MTFAAGSHWPLTVTSVCWRGEKTDPLIAEQICLYATKGPHVGEN